VLVSVDSKEVAGGRFRPKHGKTRCLSASVDSSGVIPYESRDGLGKMGFSGAGWAEGRGEGISQRKAVAQESKRVIG